MSGEPDPSSTDQTESTTLRGARRSISHDFSGGPGVLASCPTGAPRLHPTPRALQMDLWALSNNLHVPLR